MRTTTSLFFALATVATVSACDLPGVVGVPGDLTVSALLAGTAPGRLIDLKADGSEVRVPLSDRSSFLVFSSRRQSTDRLAVDIRPDAPVAFERRLRDWEAPLRGLTTPPYLIQQVGAGHALGDSVPFWVIEEVEGGEARESQVTATARYVGDHCYVFVDDELPEGRMSERIEQIGKAFDQQIFPTNTRLFGTPLASGVNGDPRITLLISPAVGNYGRDATIGYFTARDLFPPETSPGDPMLARSNRRLMLYIASNVVSRGEPADYLGTIAHELEHLINASQKIFRSDGAKAVTEELWLDEGLAMYAMEANGYGLNGAGGVVFNHVEAYQAAPAHYSLVDWDGNPDASGYGAAYLFTNYLADRFGEPLLKELVASPRAGMPNLETALRSRGATFAQVFSDWTIANILDDTGLTHEPRFQYRSLNMLGTYGGRKLRGLRLEPVTLPNTGSLRFRPYSAHYYYVPRGNAGTYRFSIAGEGGHEFGGLVVAP